MIYKFMGDHLVDENILNQKMFCLFILMKLLISDFLQIIVKTMLHCFESMSERTRKVIGLKRDR